MNRLSVNVLLKSVIGVLAGALVVARAWGSAETRDALAPVSARTLGFWLVFWLVVGALFSGGAFVMYLALVK